MVRDYELMYIVRPDLDEEALAAAMAGVETLVTAQGGEVVSTTPWGKRRLAYEIEKLRDGHYVILHVRLDAGKIKDVERLLAISDTVFRHMITIWVPEPETAVRTEDGAVVGAPVAPPTDDIDDGDIDDIELDDVPAAVLDDDEAEPDEALVGAGSAGDSDDQEER